MTSFALAKWLGPSTPAPRKVPAWWDFVIHCSDPHHTKIMFSSVLLNGQGSDAEIEGPSSKRACGSLELNLRG